MHHGTVSSLFWTFSFLTQPYRCGHCKALAPHYEEAATNLKDKNIKLAKVDCVEEAELCQSHGVQGYPCVLFVLYSQCILNGFVEPWKFFDTVQPRSTMAKGKLTVSSVIWSSKSSHPSSYLLNLYFIRQSLPAVSDVTASSIQEFKNADKIVAVAYLNSPTDAPAAEFSATADAHRDDYLFGITTDKDAIEAEGVTPPAIVVYRSFDEHRSDYPYPISSVTKEDLEDYIKELSIPIIAEVNGDNYAVYAGSSKPLAYLFLDTTREDNDVHIAAVKLIAAKYKSQMNFVWIDAVKFGDHAKALNLGEAKWPAFVVQDLGKQLKYPLDQAEAFSAEEAEKWVEQYLGGKLQPQLKSEPIPDTQDESVYTLVGKNFEDVVFDDTKDVFIEFYASWYDITF